MLPCLACVCDICPDLKPCDFTLFYLITLSASFCFRISSCSSSSSNENGENSLVHRFSAFLYCILNRSNPEENYENY